MTASSIDDKDLYWASGGGGAGMFAAVLSMVYKIYPEGPVAGAAFGFNATTSLSE